MEFIVKLKRHIHNISFSAAEGFKGISDPHGVKERIKGVQ